MAYRYAPGTHDVNRGRNRIKARIGGEVIYDRYLVNREGSHNKFYYTAIAEDNGVFYAMGAYGRIGSLGDVFNIKGGKANPRASCSDLKQALKLVQEKEKAKIKKGYVDFTLNAEEWGPEFAKMMGAYPLPPNNQYAVGGFMDEGFEYTVNQAEMRKIRPEGDMVAILDDMGRTAGAIEVDDDMPEGVEVAILDDQMNEVEVVELGAENRSFLSIVGTTAAVFLGFGLLARRMNREMKEADTDTIIENPSTGDLKPADYEEIVVESTGYYVPIIPVVLDGSFMGSRFHALPTDRYVYDDPAGIGAHIDVAMSRDTTFLPNEQALVMNSEAPGQAPYHGYDFEPRDMNYRVIHETNPVSLDGSVAKFIPTDLSGYTGQQFVPTSVYETMLGIGVSGQTPAFVAPSTDAIGANRFGSRIANPDMLANVGGPLSDGVNADYTDGTSTMSLSQWSIENQVQQISDTEAVVIARGSGGRKMIRRV